MVSSAPARNYGTMMNYQLTANNTMVQYPLHVFASSCQTARGELPGFRITVYEIGREWCVFWQA